MKISRRVVTAGLLSAPALLAKGSRPTRLAPSPREFALFDQGVWSSKLSILEELSEKHRCPAVGLGAVLGDLNRKARPVGRYVRVYADSSKRQREAYQADGGFFWDREDRRSTNWYPQGVSGSGDAWASGAFVGRRFVVVSWYAKRNVHKGARVSFVDVTDAKRPRYRHALLVEPIRSNGEATYRAVSVHAGGIAMWNHYLYVADTDWGLRVFDTRRMFRMGADRDKRRIGIHKGSPFGFDYRYALPMVGYYRQYVPADMRYSFVSLDRTQGAPRLWVGEYEEATGEGFAARFPLVASSGRLGVDDQGHIRSRESLRLNRIRTQGFVAAYGSYFFNHSYAHDRYRLHIQKPDGYQSLKAGYGLEDMHYDPTLDRLWLHTEHPGSRVVYYLNRPGGP